MHAIRIGNGAGFWGDDLSAPRRLVESADLDYLTFEHLAELTMSILAHQRARDPQRGYVADFPTELHDLLPALRDRPKLKIVANSGGMNPAGCVRHAAGILVEAGLGDVVLAAVDGDDLHGALADHVAAGEPFAHFETGAPLADLAPRTVSANAYLGAAGIVEALRAGARIVVTGRVADASLTVGPAVHEFGWSWTDWDRLAGATVAGHLIECGAQVTGGMCSAWTPDVDLVDVGYPIAEVAEDGSCTIAKPDGSGGRVSTATVAEQLVYEIGDPEHYLTPDVDADFSHVALEQVGPDRVRATGAKGRPAPPRLKVSLAYEDGWSVAGTLTVCGRGAASRARRTGEILVERARRAGLLPQTVHVECLGTGDVLPGVWPRSEPFEVVLRIGARDPSRDRLQRFLREFAPLVANGPPGITGYTGARATPVPVLAYWPTTIDRDRVRPRVETRTARAWCEAATTPDSR